MPDTATHTPYLGMRLPNGSKVVAADGQFVLARTAWGSDPYVTWRWGLSADGENIWTESGHYHRTLTEAVADFNRRAGVEI